MNHFPFLPPSLTRGNCYFEMSVVYFHANVCNIIAHKFTNNAALFHVCGGHCHAPDRPLSLLAHSDSSCSGCWLLMGPSCSYSGKDHPGLNGRCSIRKMPHTGRPVDFKVRPLLWFNPFSRTPFEMRLR